MVNSHTTETFKKGTLYEITVKNTTSETVFDSAITNGSDSQHSNDEQRYSVYAIKLTDSCMNGVMEFLKAKTNVTTTVLARACSVF